MKRTSLVTILVFVAGLGIGFIARSTYAGMLQRRMHAADLAAIEKLHQEDIEVTLSLDPKGLIDVWTEDGVRLEPGTVLRRRGTSLGFCLGSRVCFSGRCFFANPLP